MEVVKNLDDFHFLDGGYVVAIGNFDGVHVGHQKIFSLLSEKAKNLGKKSLIITFEPNPKLFFNNQDNFLLTTTDEKIGIIKSIYQIDRILVLPFNDDLKSLRPKDFIKKVLFEKINTKFLIVGENFRFGDGQSGDVNLLQEYFQNNLHVVSLQKVSEHICSSSFIKKCLKNGEIEIANKLLGYPYFIDDVVIEGNKLATKIGFPTINIRNHFKILPKFGVYIVFVIVDGRRFNGVANLGIRPTIDQNGQQILEVHILNFSENLYGKRVKVKFIQFIREERKFETLDKLIKQIDNDVREAKNLFELLL